MAAVIDATVGGTSSNSYVTLAEAEAYFVDRFIVGEGKGWDAFSDDQKTARLIFATKIIDILIFVGEKSDQQQALQWPRQDPDFTLSDWAAAGLLLIKNIRIERDEIPQQIKDAQCELALKT